MWYHASHLYLYMGWHMGMEAAIAAIGAQSPNAKPKSRLNAISGVWPETTHCNVCLVLLCLNTAGPLRYFKWNNFKVQECDSHLFRWGHLLIIWVTNKLDAHAVCPSIDPIDSCCGSNTRNLLNHLHFGLRACPVLCWMFLDVCVVNIKLQNCWNSGGIVSSIFNTEMPSSSHFCGCEISHKYKKIKILLSHIPSPLLNFCQNLEIFDSDFGFLAF